MRKKYSEQERQLIILQKLFEAKNEIENSKDLLNNQVPSIIEHLAKIWLYPYNADNHEDWIRELSDFSRTISRISDRCCNKAFIMDNLWYREGDNPYYLPEEDRKYNNKLDSVFRVAVENAASMNELAIRNNYRSHLSKFRKLLESYLNWLADKLTSDGKGAGASIPEVKEEVYSLLKKYFNDDYYELDREYTLDSGKRRHSSRRNNRKDRKLKKKGLR